MGWLTSPNNGSILTGPGSPDRRSSASENPACGPRTQRPTSPDRGCRPQRPLSRSCPSRLPLAAAPSRRRTLELTRGACMGDVTPSGRTSRQRMARKSRSCATSTMRASPATWKAQPASNPAGVAGVRSAGVEPRSLSLVTGWQAATDPSALSDASGVVGCTPTSIACRPAPFVLFRRVGVSRHANGAEPWKRIHVDPNPVDCVRVRLTSAELSVCSSEFAAGRGPRLLQVRVAVTTRTRRS